MPASPKVFDTPLTQLFNIQHPVLLAGMNVAAGPRLAAAVTNAGGAHNAQKSKRALGSP